MRDLYLILRQETEQRKKSILALLATESPLLLANAEIRSNQINEYSFAIHPSSTFQIFITITNDFDKQGRSYLLGRAYMVWIRWVMGWTFRPTDNADMLDQIHLLCTSAARPHRSTRATECDNNGGAAGSRARREAPSVPPSLGNQASETST